MSLILLAILPTYLAIIIFLAPFMGVVRLLRVMRIFRILKIGSLLLQDSNILLRSLLMARRKILIFHIAPSVSWLLSLASIFVIEGPENGFNGIPHSIYWAIVTITTVGYGRHDPSNRTGKADRFAYHVVGLLHLSAVPTGLLLQSWKANEMNFKQQELVKCPNCNRAFAGHDSDAMFCKHCASELADLTSVSSLKK
ncbi:ion transporter [Vibrio lentus]|nr:ion transporter [Vibrio lentus]